jgi:subtilase family serine protease
MRYAPPITILLTLIMFLLVFPSSAIYNEEGISVETIAQGTIRGMVQTNGTYGLANPPVELSFQLPAEPSWSRVYAGVWGGTEFYSGWAEFEVNGKTTGKILLYGKDDQTAGVYTSSHGVYWIALDGHGLLHTGPNTVIVHTSRGEEGSKLDGRIYAIQSIAIIEDANGPLSQYWIAEGNDNLHGEGWAGKNPTRKDQADVVFGGAFPGLSRSGELTVLLLATNYGQPDFVQFNGKDLGQEPIADPGLYSPGARDIGNENSFDAGGGTGIKSRYVDFERFSLSDAIAGTNRITFLRGRDLDGDGRLATSGSPTEAEDYIHPVFVALVSQLSGTTAPIDLAVSDLQVREAYSGSTAEVIATVLNFGAIPPGGAEVLFESDGQSVGSQLITIDHTGIREVSIPWKPETGSHELKARVTAPGDTRPENNEIRKQVSVGGLPDLSVSIGTPERAGTPAPAPTRAPLSLLPALLSLLGSLAVMIRRRARPVQFAAILFIGTVVLAGIPALAPPAHAAGELSQYTIPIEVKNLGGSDAGPCSVSLALDGQRVAVHTLTQGISAGDSVRVSLTVMASPGSHQLLAFVDEAGQVADSNRSNNQAQGSYVFP